MRLWHQLLIPYLDRQRLLGAHRECCALRGKGWGKKHATVDYAFKEPNGPAELVAYHYLVMDEMEKRGYNPDSNWRSPFWRGSVLGLDQGFADPDMVDDQYVYATKKNGIIYPEHDQLYLFECIQLLNEKNANWDRALFDSIYLSLAQKGK